MQIGKLHFRRHHLRSKSFILKTISINVQHIMANEMDDI